MNRLMILTGCAALMAFGAVAEEEELEVPRPATNQAPVKVFTALPLCLRVEGLASVRKPKGEWEEAEEGKYYPLGTSFRAEKNGILSVAFGMGARVTVADGSEFATREQPIETESRTISVVRGTLEVKLPDNLHEGAFFVTAPGFTIKNPAGESRLVYEDMGDGDKAVIRCVTGSLGVEGRHFDIPVMRAANELDIRTSRDHLFSSLYGNSGDFVVNLNQGLRYKDEFGDDGKLKQVIEKGNLEWHMTPRTKIIINRSVPSVGERMSVHTMAFDAVGERKSECYFCEGRAEVNSGEVVAHGKLSQEDIVKRANAATAEKPADNAESASENEAEKKESEETSNEEE